jgi:glycosyltransferase involved in cell wall biosynthesis
MKVSIITPTYNSEKTISRNLQSIKNQTYKNIEHIIIDNFSTDRTLNIINKYKNNKIKIFKNKTSIYEAMNLGIKKSSGEIILIIGSDDLLINNSTIENVVSEFKKRDIDVYSGGVAYFRNADLKKITRIYSFSSFNISYFDKGLMPAHPATFIKKKIYKKYGLYKTKYKIASDFDFLKRIFSKNIKIQFTEKIFTRMQIGGVSTKGLSSYIKISQEIIDILNKTNTNKIFIYINTYLRFIYKIQQLIIKNKYKNNIYEYNNPDSINNKPTQYNFKIIKNINSIFKNKEFILSALNLAFLGYWYKFNKFDNYKFLLWPDGIFSKFIRKDLKKIPGRDLIKKLKLPSYIKRILVIGNIDKNSKVYLEKNYNKKIFHIKLPYGNIEEIEKLIPKTYSNDLIILTLPTPKQELLALMVFKNKKSKIICIGGALNMLANKEKVTPLILYKLNLEFLWRLRFDTIRRLKRLLESFYYFFMGCFSRAYENFNIIK